MKNRILLSAILYFFSLNALIISAQDPFITKWVTSDGSITIPTTGSGYNYDIIWDNLNGPESGLITGVTGNFTIDSLPSGDTIQVEISGVFPRIYFNGTSGGLELLDISYWGDMLWQSFNSAFKGCENMIITATDTPDLSHVTSMYAAFYECKSLTATPAMSGWDVSYVTDMSRMFLFASDFNQDIGGWDVGNVTDMSFMFYIADTFNQDIGGWNVSNVTNMDGMFYNAHAFNQNIGGWDVSNVTIMKAMFSAAISFNQDINGWNVSSVITMKDMFLNAFAFDQNLGAWNLNSLTSGYRMFNAPAGQGMSCEKFGETIKGWATNPNTASGVNLGTLNRDIPSNYQAYIDYLENSKSWIFPDPVGVCAPNTSAFITKWVTIDGDITIPTTGSGYNYNISWISLNGLGSGSGINITGDTTIAGLTVGDTILVEITGNFPRIYFNGSFFITKPEIIDIFQWGDIHWASFNSAFQECVNLIITASDTPDLSSVTDMSYAFYGCASLTVNSAINGWDVSNVTDMQNLFCGADVFNQDISTWNVSNVTNMGGLFSGADVFNQDIGNWEVSSVTDMSGMFSGASAFNQDIGGWNVSNVTNMGNMFSDADVFNQDIGNWDVSNVTDMHSMFIRAGAFNQDIGNWDVSNVTTFSRMFQSANSFNQSLGSWNLSSISKAQNMFDAPVGQGMSCENFGETIKGWATNPTTASGINLGALNRDVPSNYQVYLDYLDYSLGWGYTFPIGTCSANTSAFFTKWVSTDGSITIPTTGSGYNYNISWINLNGLGSGSGKNITGDTTISGLISGDTILVEIAGNFPRIYFNYNATSVDEIVEIYQWGDIMWTSFENAFNGCSHLVMTATDTPNLSNVTDMSAAFKNCTSLTTNVAMATWNASTVTDMSNMFSGAYAFNQDISGWDVSNVTDMSRMFYSAIAFNQDIGTWDVSNVTDMNHMFYISVNFNQDIGNWDVSSVTDMSNMFAEAYTFNQELGSWELSSLTNAAHMFDNPEGHGLSCINFSETLRGWATNPNTASGIVLGTMNRTILPGYEIFISTLINDKSWTFSTSIDFCSNSYSFITKWRSKDGSITIPTTGSGYNYDIKWFNLTQPGMGIGKAIDQNGGYTISGLPFGDKIQVEIMGAFPRIYFNNGSESNEIIDITQWGDIQWQSFKNAFNGCDKMVMSAIDTPDLSSVTDMYNAFYKCNSFTANDAINGWDVSNVTDMSGMFYRASSFNQDIGNWDVSNVNSMSGMFREASSFNQDIGNWDVSNVTDMHAIFLDASSFNQDIGGWDLISLAQATGMFNTPTGQGMSCENFGETIKGWALNPNTASGITLGTLNRSVPANYQVYVDSLVNGKGWTIPFGIATCFTKNSFITKWVVNDGSITIPTQGTGYNYDLSWFDLSSPGGGEGYTVDLNGNYTISGLTIGDTYSVVITGDFPRIYFNFGGGRNEITDISQWGDIHWESFNSAFEGCSNMIMSAIDTPSLSNVTDMHNAFFLCSSLTTNNAMADWDIGNITDMSGMFQTAINFNQDISTWDVGNVTDMSNIFRNAFNFNQDISNWDVDSVRDMSYMFTNAYAYTQNLDGWNLNSLIDATDMFNAPAGQGMSCENFGKTILGWASNPNTPNNITLGALNREYPSDVQDEIDHLVNDKGWTINGTIGTCAPLPITLISFEAVCEQGKINLEWATSSEVNNDFFTLERSINGYNWKVIATIDGAGTSKTIQEYAYNDNPYGILNSDNAFYYRLKQTDKDGAYAYSDIVLARCDRVASEVVQVFPNPSAGSFILRGLRGNSEIFVHNTRGETIYTTSTITNSIKIHLDAPAGMYFLIVNSDAGTVKKKIVIGR